MLNHHLFDRYASVLRGPTPPSVRDPRLLMEEEGPVRIYYAPFEYLNPQARVVLVGITPGPTQMVNANNTARRALMEGHAPPDAMRLAKRTAAFSGEPFRTNLINQLNHWGFHHWLGLDDCSELFGAAANLVQTTSLLRYPVFVNDEDYRGTPDMIKHRLLHRYLVEHFVAEVEALPDAIFVGLGPQVQKVLAYLVGNRSIMADRVIGGLLHPSGRCTYRINYLTRSRSGRVPHATNPRPYDAGRAVFRRRFVEASAVPGDVLGAR
jgi:hypothetical protein